MRELIAATVIAVGVFLVEWAIACTLPWPDWEYTP